MKFSHLTRIVGSFIDQVLHLEKNNPNDQDFGKAVRNLIRLFNQEDDPVE
jgi:hypothetical protein